MLLLLFVLLFICLKNRPLHSVQRDLQAAGNVIAFASVLCGLCISAVDCGEPQPFQNGSITGGSTVYPNVIYLSCDDGFILRGSSKIQCQANGTWSKTTSFCKGHQSAFFLLFYYLRHHSEMIVEQDKVAFSYCII